MISFNYSEIFNIDLNMIIFMILLFVLAVILLNGLIYLYKKLLKGKKRITDKKHITDLEIDKHEVNNYLNGLNKKRRKSDINIDIKEF